MTTFSKSLASIGGVIAAGWEKAGQVIGAVKEWLGGLFTQNQFGDADKERWRQAGRDLVNAIWDGMKSVFEGLIAWWTGRLDVLLQGVAGLANKAAGLFGTTGNAPAGAPNRAGVINGARAGGGPISRGGTYLVGEKGPELITASRAGYVNSTGAAIGAAPSINLGGVTINAPPGASPGEIAREVRAQIEDMVRAAFRGVQADTGLSVY